MAIANPERAYAEKFSPRESDLTQNETEVQRYFSQENPHSSIKKFGNVYGEDGVLADERKVQSFIPEFQEKTERSGILEAALPKVIEDYGWFGENGVAFRTAEYDDVVNSVDAVLEWRTEKGIVRLAVDITTSEDEGVLSDKITGIEQDINRGTLSKIKHFYSKRENFRGEIACVPKVILGFNREGVREFCDLVAPTLRKGLEVEKRKEELRNSNFRFFLLEQAESQLHNEFKSVWESFFRKIRKGEIKPMPGKIMPKIGRIEPDSKIASEAEEIFNLLVGVKRRDVSCEEMMQRASKLRKMSGIFSEINKEGKQVDIFENTLKMADNILGVLRMLKSDIGKEKAPLRERAFVSDSFIHKKLTEDRNRDSIRPRFLP